MKKRACNYFAYWIAFALMLILACESDDGLSEDSTPPTAPSALKFLEVNDTSVLLSWGISQDNVRTTGYLVYQNNVIISTDSLTRHLASNLKPETNYDFKIRAVDAAGNISGFSPEISATTLKTNEVPDMSNTPGTPDIDNTDTVAPTIPQNLRVIDIAETTANLGWDASTDSVSVVEYRIFQDSTFLATVSNTDYNFTELLSDTKYSLSVSAIDEANNESGRSEIVTFTTAMPPNTIAVDTIPPTKPLDLVAVDSTQTTIDFSWSRAMDSVGVTGYRVFQDTILLDTVIGTEFQAVNLTAGTSYTFSITSFDEARNESEASDALTVFTQEQELLSNDNTSPTAPKNLTVQNITQSTVDLQWDASTDSVGVAGYRIFQDTILLDSIIGTEYQVVGLIAGSSYSFTVTAFDDAENESETSDPLTVTPLEEEIPVVDTTAPTIPTDLTASNVTPTTVDLQWDVATDSVGVIGYRIFENSVLLDTVVGNEYQVVDLTAGTSYSFTVTAFDEAENESEESDPVAVTTQREEVPATDNTAPTIPTGLTALSVSQTTVDLRWNAASDSGGVTGYNLFQNGELGNSASENSLQVTGLTPNTSYEFTVSAFDAEGNESEISDALAVITQEEEVSATDTTAPTIPVNLTAQNMTQTTVDLQWDAATDSVGVSGYNLFQNDQLVNSISSTNIQVTALTPNTSYEFTVSAFDDEGNESDKSESTAVNTLEEMEPPALSDKILVFTKTAEFRHGSIAKGVATISALAAANNFEVEQTENAADFILENLEQYQAVVFLSTTGDVLNNTQQAAFESYIQSGGSYMGIHAASDTEYDWAWYGRLVGAYFNGHPEIQQASIDVLDDNHLSTTSLSDPWTRIDEWYNFRDINPGINILLSLNESTYTGGTNGTSHPIAWYHQFDGGRSFYTGGGHSDSNFDEPDFRAHLLGGILYCLGR